MENYSIIIFILAIMIGLSAVADKMKLPYPILLIIAGIGIGWAPSLPDVELNPEIVLVGNERHRVAGYRHRAADDAGRWERLSGTE